MEKQPQYLDVSVGILSGKEINFCLNGIFKFSKDKTLSGNQKATIYNNKIELNGIAFNEIILLPTTPETNNFDLYDVIIGKNFHWQQKEKQRFSGILKIIIENEQLTAINILPVEDYLTSVISSEMSATSSLELLKAHAVISRSWLLAQIEKNKKIETKKYQSSIQTKNELIRWYDREDHLNFDVCADDHCQRYQGISRASTVAVKEAVQATAGEILTYNNQICDARFSKSCGGVSELFENCWEEQTHPYLTKVIDNTDEYDNNAFDLSVESNAEKWIRSTPKSFCNTSDKNILSQVLNSYDQNTSDFFRWKISYTQKELSSLIKKRSGIDFGEITDLIPIQRGSSGRIIKLKICGTIQTFCIGKELEIRKTLSENHLYSSAFIAEKKKIENNIPQEFILYGAGWGHGVGLCQIGAAVMATKGYSYKEILAHYYKNTEISSRY